MRLKIKIGIMLLIIIFVSLCLIVKASTIDTVLMYSADNRTIEVKATEVEAYQNVGWYVEPVVQMYAVDGRTRYTLESEIEAYKNVGWYLEPMILMYAADGRTLYVGQSEVEAYKNVGWFLTEREAKESVIDQQELLLLAKTIHAEAADNNYTDRCYVGAVVMNRVDSGIWGNSVRSVVTARGQYACYGNKKFNRYPPEECLQIAKELMLGERYGMPPNVIFQAQFRQGKGVFAKVGVHYYCYGNI